MFARARALTLLFASSAALITTLGLAWYEIDYLSQLERSYEAAFRRVRLYRELHLDAAARRAFEEYLTLTGKSFGERAVVAALMSEGHFMSMSDSEEAVGYYSRALSLRPDYGPGYEVRGHWYLQHREFGAAVLDFNKAIKLKYGDGCAEPYEGRSAAYLGLSQFNAALADADSAIQIDSRDYWAFASRARVYAQLNQPQLALADWNEAIKLSVDYIPSLYEERADLYASIGRLDLASRDRATAAAFSAAR
ncbi:MAG: hypothetical protein JSS86_24165 [Cyanobacteria bacterium SZAS LIN-2]|nr:hypothetical protein [Cyanobacteria bacterium SZAS LIN-2]